MSDFSVHVSSHKNPLLRHMKPWSQSYTANCCQTVKKDFVIIDDNFEKELYEYIFDTLMYISNIVINYKFMTVIVTVN